MRKKKLPLEAWQKANIQKILVEDRIQYNYYLKHIKVIIGIEYDSKCNKDKILFSYELTNNFLLYIELI